MTSYTLTCCIIIHHSKSIQIDFAISKYIISLLKEDYNLHIDKNVKARSKNKRRKNKGKLFLFESYISKRKRSIKKGLEILKFLYSFSMLYDNYFNLTVLTYFNACSSNSNKSGDNGSLKIYLRRERCMQLLGVCLYCEYMHRRRKRKYWHRIWQSIIDTWRESRSFVILHARGIAIRCTKHRSLFEEIKPQKSLDSDVYLLPMMASSTRFWNLNI